MKKVKHELKQQQVEDESKYFDKTLDVQDSKERDWVALGGPLLHWDWWGQRIGQKWLDRKF